MTKEKSKEKEKCSHGYGYPTGGGIYCMGMIGAAVYYISTASGFWGGAVGFLKALVWPAFMVYEVLKYIAM